VARITSNVRRPVTPIVTCDGSLPCHADAPGAARPARGGIRSRALDLGDSSVMDSARMVMAVEQGSPAVPSCVTEDTTSLCARVYEASGLDWLAANADALIEKPATILLVVVLAAVVRLMLHRGIRRLTDRTATGAMPTVLRPWRNRARQADPDGVELIIARRTQRAEAIGSVLRSFASIVVLGISVVLVLGELGLDLAPIIASAGVIGVALGFGAQNLVKDFIAGIGIILEDQYGVGDVVDLGEASGTVEAVGLRITRLRDVNGVVWYVRNGEVLRVGNRSQGYAQVVIDMPVAHDTDLDRCRRVMQEVADVMAADEEWAPVLLAEPESLGVEQIAAEGVTMRVQVRTTNADQWRVARELRMRLKERLVAEGIRMPPPLVGAGVSTGAGLR
jgi:small conductance mechanosensitive channel